MPSIRDELRTALAGSPIDPGPIAPNLIGWYAPGLERLALGVENQSTYAHELIHAADQRLGELPGSTKISAEIVAELGGAILLTILGYEHAADLGGAYSYISNWAGKSNPVAACIKLLDRTCKAVQLILDTAERCKVLHNANASG